METYHCPYCNAQLNVDGNVVLSWQSSDRNRGIVFLSDTLGDYSVAFGSKVSLPDGERLDIYCPACSESLQYSGNKNLIRINRCNKFNDHSTILFSAIIGEKSTFEVNEERTLTYGENAMRYMDPNWYEKLQGNK